MTEPPFWTPERVAELQALWERSSFSASEIAGMMGCSKNAVIGKVHRLNLKQRRPSYREANDMTTANPFPPYGRCAYPIGHPGTPDFRFCGAGGVEVGRSYCPEHAAICYVKNTPAAVKSDVPKVAAE